MATAPITPEETEGPSRRLGLRRARAGGGSGFSGGSSTSLESYRPADAVDEEVEEPETVVDLPTQIRGAIPRLAPPAAPAPDDDPHENRRRLAEAAMAGDSAYAKEFRLGLLHRLLMRNISLDNIARELGVSISTVKNDRAELRKRLRQTARELDINELIGGQLAFYDETAAMSLRVSSQQGVPTAMKLAAIRTALAAKADQTRFLTSAGVFDVLSFRKAEDGSDLSDVQVLMQRTEEMLARLVEEGQGEEPPPAPTAKKVVRRTRPGSFTRLSFDDASSSNSDDETVEL